MKSVLVILLLACTALPVGAQEKLVLLSPHSDETKNEFSNAFEAWYAREHGTEIDTEWLDVGGGTSSILRYIKSEYGVRPEGIGIDVFFGGGLDPYVELGGMGLFETYKLPDDLLARIPAKIGGIPVYDPGFTWYGATLAGFGIVYNKKVLEILDFEVPSTWAELGDPKLYSWVGSGDPRSSGSVHMAYELILQAYGWEKGWEVITTLGANVRNFAGGGSQAPKDVAVGEVAFGLSIDFYAWAHVAEVGEDYVGFTMPDNLTIVNPDGLGILKGAPNRKAAEAFVTFVMSDDGQKLWFLKRGAPGGPVREQLNRFTVIPDLYDTHRANAAVTLNPFKWKSDLVYDSAAASARWSVLNDLIGALVIDSHHLLTAAFREAGADGLTRDEIERLSAVPLSESAAAELGTNWRSDPELRVRKLGEWTAFARDKYGDVEESLAAWLFDLATLIFPVAIAGGTIVYIWRMR